MIKVLTSRASKIAENGWVILSFYAAQLMSSANCGVGGQNLGAAVSVQRRVVFLAFSARPPP